MANLSGQQRWHDNRGNLTKMMYLLETMPDELREIVVAGINGRADKCWGVESMLKSLGREKLLSLYQSHKKRRSYDQDPLLFKTVNYFMILPKEKQDLLATSGLQFTRNVVEYIANCKHLTQEPRVDDIQQMMSIYVDSGEDAVSRFIQEKFPEFDFTENIVGGDSGLTVRRTSR